MLQDRKIVVQKKWFVEIENNQLTILFNQLSAKSYF